VGEFENLVTRVTRILNDLQLSYVVVGGFAVIFYGRSRTTTDLDIIVENDPDKFKQFLESLKKTNFDVMENQIQMVIKEETNISIFDNESMLRVDLKLARGADEREVLQQAIDETYKGLKIRVAPVEQVLYGKILYLGDISDIPDAEMLSYGDIVDFITVFRRHKDSNLDWLKSKVGLRGLDTTLQRLLKLARSRFTIQKKLF
jgi:transcriptional regulator NrdR family protein